MASALLSVTARAGDWRRLLLSILYPIITSNNTQSAGDAGINDFSSFGTCGHCSLFVRQLKYKHLSVLWPPGSRLSSSEIISSINVYTSVSGVATRRAPDIALSAKSDGKVKISNVEQNSKAASIAIMV